MLTQSGILILPDGQDAPALEDIALGLGRMPRFAGQTRGWWSVLHHSFVVDRIITAIRQEPSLRLAALLHDAHEAVTGDVPTTWKTVDLKERQRQLDLRLAARYNIRHFGHPLIRTADREALLAEGKLVGPPGFTALEGEPHPSGLFAVEYIRSLYPDPQDTIDLQGRGVRAFISLIRNLQHAHAEHRPE